MKQIVSYLFVTVISIYCWTPVTVNMNPPIIPQMQGWQTVNMVPDIHCAVTTAGYEEASSEPQNALMAYNIALNRWDFLDVSAAYGGPQSDYIGITGHDQGATCYDANLKAIFIPTTYAMGSISSNMTQFDIRGNIGRNYYPVPFSTPFTANLAFSCFDPDSNCIYILNSSHGGPVGRFVRYKASENKWKLLASCPQSLNGMGQSICYDKKSKRVRIPGNYAYDPSKNAWESSAALTGYVVYNSVADTVVSKAEPAEAVFKPSPSRGVIFDPITNRYLHIDMGGSLYTAKVYEEAGESGTGNPKPTFTKESYDNDYRWITLADGLQYSQLGFAQMPVITSHQGTLYLAWNEWASSSYPPTTSASTVIGKLNGSSWNMNLVKGNYYCSYPVLQSFGSNLYMSREEMKPWGGTHNPLFEVSANRIDTILLGGPISNMPLDGSSLPQLVIYKNKLNMLYLKQRSDRIYGLMGHALWSDSLSKWSTVEDTLFYPPYSLTRQNPSAFMSSFSAKSFGDSIVAAVTLVQADPLPLTLSFKCFDGTIWKNFPTPSLVDTNHVCVFPSFAVDSNRHEMYIGYTRRLYSGRNNNELVVEKWDGTGWEPLGSSLNVNDLTKDGWAFRPSLAVSPAGVLYVAWNEHVWGSSPQVYVAHWNGSSWVRDFMPGTSLNNNGTDGSAQSVSLTFDGDKPTVAWAEHVFGDGSYRKIYVKQFTGETTAETANKNSRDGYVLKILSNPFSSLCGISVSLPKQSKVVLSIYNTTGKIVSKLTDGGLNAGIHHFQWNGNDLNGKALSAGMYVCKLTTGSKVLTNKIIIAR